jgi:hypothetical protein
MCLWGFGVCFVLIPVALPFGKPGEILENVEAKSARFGSFRFQ